jgi:hypothetical protein
LVRFGRKPVIFADRTRHHISDGLSGGRLAATVSKPGRRSFEFMGRTGELSSEQIALRARYSEGPAAYRERRWDEAVSALKAALAATPGDGPCKVLLARVESLRVNPPPADWGGSWHLDRADQTIEVGNLSKGVGDAH